MRLVKVVPEHIVPDVVSCEHYLALWVLLLQLMQYRVFSNFFTSEVFADLKVGIKPTGHHAFDAHQSDRGHLASQGHQYGLLRLLYVHVIEQLNPPHPLVAGRPPVEALPHHRLPHLYEILSQCIYQQHNQLALGLGGAIVQALWERLVCQLALGQEDPLDEEVDREREKEGSRE